MDKKIFIGILIFAGIVLSIIFINSDIIGISSEDNVIDTTFAPSSDTVCYEDDTCSLTIHGEVMNVWEDKTWKRRDEARSLVGSGIDCVIESDDENLIECIDWNITSMTLRLSQKTVSLTPKEVPLKIYRVNKTDFRDIENITLHELNNKFEKIYETTKSFSSLSNSQDITLSGLKYDDVIHFGETSTTIQLQADNTGNMADLLAYTSSGGGNTAYQTMWNITTVPAGQIIERSDLCGYAYDVTGGLEPDVTIVRIQDWGWTESLAATEWGSQTEVNSTSKTYSGSTENTWACVNVSIQVRADYLEGNINTSIRIWNPSNDPGSPDITLDAYGLAIGSNADYVAWDDREDTGGSGNPLILNITYRADNTCTCAGLNQNWEIDLSDYCVLTTTCDLGTGDLSFTGTGNFTCAAALSVTDVDNSGLTSGDVVWVDPSCAGVMG